MYKHDIEITESNPDEQTTVWVMSCKRCGMHTRPLYSKPDAAGATDELSCPLAPEVAHVKGLTK